MDIPRQLSINLISPFYNKEACLKIGKVFVDGVHLPMCYAYDMQQGWAKNIIDGIWQPKKYGVITVELHK